MPIGTQGTSLWNLICVQGQYHAGTGFDPLVPAKGNFKATAYKEILYNCNTFVATVWRTNGLYEDCDPMYATII